nr:hypothetical transcript [Hymenolepis microstoma]
MLSDVFKSCRENGSFLFLFLALVLIVVSAILLTTSLLTPIKHLDIAVWTVLAIALFIVIVVFVKNCYRVLKLRRQKNEETKDFDPNWDTDKDYILQPNQEALGGRRNALQ